MNKLTTAESRALKSSFEAMGKLTRAYNSHKVTLKPVEEPPRVSVLDHLEWMDQ